MGKTISELKTRISEEKQKIRKARQRAANYLAHIKENSLKLEDYFNPLLSENSERIEREIQKLTAPMTGGWTNEKWSTWKFDRIILENKLCTGYLVESRKKCSDGMKVPVFLPFIGCNRTVFIVGREQVNDSCLSLLQSIAIRTALMFPHQARFTLLDPAGHGGAFPMSQYLPMVRKNTGDVRQDVDSVIRDVRRIIATYLDASVPSFEMIQEVIRSNEQFEFIFAANFPRQYDRRAIEGLQSLGNNGPNAGRYLFIHYNADQAMPRDMSIKDFENAYFIDLMQCNENVKGITSCDLRFKADTAPPPKMQKELLTKLNLSKPPERILYWNEIGNIPEEEWWMARSQTVIKTPIGGKGTTGSLDLWFGVNHENRPCAHGMLGAMTGAGKSNLYHVLIIGLGIRYSPEELRLYLIDGKDGVEFQIYRNLPHAEVVSLRTAPELSRSILTELIAEKERRNSMFARSGVRDFLAYREKGQPEGKLARILLLVDEYQELFEGDKQGTASAQLLQISQQGRSAGIHMLLASQRFGAPGMLNQTPIFGNIHLRIAMQMTLSDRQALSEFGREGKHLIETCNLPGKIVINDQSGDDGANHLGKVAFIKSEQIDELLNKLNVKAKREMRIESLPMTVIFDGKTQPNFIENPHVGNLLERSRRFTAEEWESFARKSSDKGGLQVLDWFWAEHPKAVWLGQEFNVRNQATIVLRRRMSENILMIGNVNTVRYGMLAATICSLALSSEPEKAKFIVIDRSIPGSQWNQALKVTSEKVLAPAGFRYAFDQKTDTPIKLIEKIESETDRRSALAEEDTMQLPSIFFFITESDRIFELVRKMGKYGKTSSPAGDKLKKIYIDGPSVGIHTILSFSEVGAMKSVLDERKELEFFKHRVALEMSEDDSFTFVRNRKASMLQLEGTQPVSGLYADMQKNRTIRFKPYSIEATIDFDSQMKKIGNHLKAWRNVA